MRSDLQTRLDAIDRRLEQLEQLIGHLVVNGDAVRQELADDAEALAELTFGLTRLTARLELGVEAARELLERADPTSSTASDAEATDLED